MINENSKWLIYGIVAIVVAVLAYGFLSMQDRRSTTERIGDAIHELPKGVDKAERQLRDRTPGDKINDGINDTVDDMNNNTK